MFRVKLNVPLFVLAIIGVVLYFGVNQWYLSKGETDMDNAETKPKISREAAESAALNWYKAYFASAEPKLSRTILNADRNMNTFIGKNNLDKTYNDTFGNKYPRTFWEVELRPENGSDHKMFVRVATESAEVIGWEETTASGVITTGAGTDDEIRLEGEKALTRAGYNPNDFTYEWVENKNILGQVTGSESRFISHSQRIEGAVLSLKVAVVNGKTTTLLPYFETPQSFKTWMSGQERSAAIMSLASVVLTGILGLVALIFVIVNEKKPGSPGA
ncbi:hypothetical protein [Gorillibacterium massiliense]|uniref:hypothetical protein n=1 Tax=Gorillibacterium massiliense TaxID=1280390 RepID=UPI000592670C|nr:hypothetical protein [Gorillibacterium massiliense]